MLFVLACNQVGVCIAYKLGHYYY